jgi:hypothetical protein
MNHTIIAAIAAAKRAYVTALASLVIASPALSVLGGCDSPPSSPAVTETMPPDVPILVRQADGRELMTRVSRAQEGSIGIVKEVPAAGHPGSGRPGYVRRSVGLDNHLTSHRADRGTPRLAVGHGAAR